MHCITLAWTNCTVRYVSYSLPIVSFLPRLYSHETLGENHVSVAVALPRKKKIEKGETKKKKKKTTPYPIFIQIFTRYMYCIYLPPLPCHFFLVWWLSSKPQYTSPHHHYLNYQLSTRFSLFLRSYQARVCSMALISMVMV